MRFDLRLIQPDQEQTEALDSRPDAGIDEGPDDGEFFEPVASLSTSALTDRLLRLLVECGRTAAALRLARGRHQQCSPVMKASRPFDRGPIALSPLWRPAP